MDLMNELFESVKLVAEDAISQMYYKLCPQEPQTLEQCLKHYFNTISATKGEELLRDLRNFKGTPATITLAVITVPTLVLASRLLAGGQMTSNATCKAKLKKKKKKKQQTKAQKSNKEIQIILDFVEETYVPQIDRYIENYIDLSDEDKVYKFKYFEEMLLKELMNLDNVDVVGNDVLRKNRKKVIRFIQDHQKRLDTFKKEN